MCNCGKSSCPSCGGGIESSKKSFSDYYVKWHENYHQMAAKGQFIDHANQTVGGIPMEQKLPKMPLTEEFKQKMKSVPKGSIASTDGVKLQDPTYLETAISKNPATHQSFAWAPAEVHEFAYIHDTSAHAAFKTLFPDHKNPYLNTGIVPQHNSKIKNYYYTAWKNVHNACKSIDDSDHPCVACETMTSKQFGSPSHKSPSAPTLKEMQANDPVFQSLTEFKKSPYWIQGSSKDSFSDSQAEMYKSMFTPDPYKDPEMLKDIEEKSEKVLNSADSEPQPFKAYPWKITKLDKNGQPVDMEMKGYNPSITWEDEASFYEEGKVIMAEAGVKAPEKPMQWSGHTHKALHYWAWDHDVSKKYAWDSLGIKMHMTKTHNFNPFASDSAIKDSPTNWHKEYEGLPWQDMLAACDAIDNDGPCEDCEEYVAKFTKTADDAKDEQPKKMDTAHLKAVSRFSYHHKISRYLAYKHLELESTFGTNPYKVMGPIPSAEWKEGGYSLLGYKPVTEACKKINGGNLCLVCATTFGIDLPKPVHTFNTIAADQSYPVNGIYADSISSNKVFAPAYSTPYLEIQTKDGFLLQIPMGELQMENNYNASPKISGTAGITASQLMAMIEQVTGHSISMKPKVPKAKKPEPKGPQTSHVLKEHEQMLVTVSETTKIDLPENAKTTVIR